MIGDFFFILKYKALKATTGVDNAAITHTTTFTIGMRIIGIIAIIACAGCIVIAKNNKDKIIALTNFIYNNHIPKTYERQNKLQTSNGDIRHNKYI